MDSPTTPTSQTEPQTSQQPNQAAALLNPDIPSDTELRVLAIMRWLARGYTIRFIQQAAIRQKWPFAPTPDLIIKIREDQDAAIQEFRKLEADETMRSGPATRPERIRRLSQLADDLESRIENSEAPSPRLVSELRATLRDIRDETAPRPGYSPNQDDTWLVLLQRLAPPTEQLSDMTQSINMQDSIQSGDISQLGNLGGVRAGAGGAAAQTREGGTGETIDEQASKP